MTNETPIDAAWVRGVLDRYEQDLVRYAHRLTRDLETARDVVQDTFLRLIRVGKPSVEDHLAEWLFTVCRNRCLDVLRKERRMTGMSDQTAETLAHEDAPAPPREQSETHAKVLSLLDQLPPRQQEVIRLKFQSGLSYKEISRVTDLTVTNVGFLIHTGLKTVRERLHKQPVQSTDSPSTTNLGIAR